MDNQLYRLRLRFAIPMTFFFLFFGIGAIQPFVVPHLRTDFGMSPLRASSVIGVLYLVFGIARFFTRYLIRWIEKRNTIILGAIGYLCLPLSLSFGATYAFYMLGAVLMGMGAALVWTASSVQVLDTSEEKSYGAASGLMYFFVQAGIFLGTILAGAVAARGGYRAVFHVSSAIGGLAILAAIAVPQVRSKLVDDRWSVAFRFLSNPAHLFVPAALAVAFGIYGIMLTMFNQYAATTFGPGYLTLFHTCYLLTGMAVTPVAGKLSDRMGRTPTIALSFLAGALGLCLFGFVKAKALFVAGAVLVGIPFGAIPTAALAWIGDHSVESDRPTIHACVFAWRDLGFVGVTYLGVFLQGRQVPLQDCFRIFAVVFLASAIFSGFLGYRERQASRNPGDGPLEPQSP